MVTEILLGTATESSHARGGNGLQTVPSYAQIVAADQPLAHYSMDEAAGATTALDSSGFGRHGSYIGDRTLGTPGLVRRTGGKTAARFAATGAAGGLTVPYASWMDQGSFSAEIWYQRVAGSGGYIMGRGSYFGSTNRVWALEFSGSSLYVMIFKPGGASTFWSIGDLGTTLWHLVLTQGTPIDLLGNGTSFVRPIRLYANSQRILDSSVEADLTPNPSTVGMGIGVNAGGTTNVTNVVVDEAVFYDYELSQAQITARYQQGIVDPPRLLLPHTESDEAQGLLAQRDAPIYGRKVILPASETDSIPATGLHGPSREFKIPTVVETYLLENITDAPPWGESFLASSEANVWNVPFPLQERGLWGISSTEEAVPLHEQFDQTLELGVAFEAQTVSRFPHDLGNDIEMVVETAIVDSLIPRADLHLTATGTLSLASEVITMDPVLALTILDDELRRAPTSLTFMMTGAREGMQVSVYFDSDTVAAWTGEPNSEGMIGPLAINVPNTLLAGAHTLRAEVGAVVVATAPFTLALDPALAPIVAGADAQAVEIPGAVQHDTRHWVFQDLLAESEGGIGSFIMPINPTRMGSPHYEHGMTTRHTTAITGQFHVFQTGSIPKEWTFEGYCPDQATQEAMLAYRNLNRRFYIIDHRNRAWKVIITDMKFVPRLRHNFNGVQTDWGSDYTVTATIFDQDWVTPA